MEVTMKQIKVSDSFRKDRVRKMTINGTKDNWICLCGNTAQEYGFFPCSSEGEMVEPTPEEWNSYWYVCDKCGRIIDQETLAVKGVRFNNTLTMDELIEAV
jgi:hypothetical protein